MHLKVLFEKVWIGTIQLQPCLIITTLKGCNKCKITDLFDKAGLIWLFYKQAAKALTLTETVKAKPDANPQKQIWYHIQDKRFKGRT